ncbi:hypothetical protein PPERSA_01608 [Pseudocohnilembus persalinus]|uniref:Uncharacterized protein n=1 Tax=Pseudocohnilembus persalinus TaxID=266149 RepID=A0A0V0QHY2_PSEPJ|nr:hypothetical protein PPERSA_01608 [Pseudocohnilembus persalinus]|eukprot:KRX01738.1 hypothetical protein PPERSA_01608 [Pseudocohnilembus persalinus]
MNSNIFKLTKNIISIRNNTILKLNIPHYSFGVQYKPKNIIDLRNTQSQTSDLQQNNKSHPQKQKNQDINNKNKGNFQNKGKNQTQYTQNLENLVEENLIGSKTEITREKQLSSKIMKSSNIESLKNLYIQSKNKGQLNLIHQSLFFNRFVVLNKAENYLIANNNNNKNKENVQEIIKKAIKDSLNKLQPRLVNIQRSKLIKILKYCYRLNLNKEQKFLTELNRSLFKRKQILTLKDYTYILLGNYYLRFFDQNIYEKLIKKIISSAEFESIKYDLNKFTIVVNSCYVENELQEKQKIINKCFQLYTKLIQNINEAENFDQELEKFNQYQNKVLQIYANYNKFDLTLMKLHQQLLQTQYKNIAQEEINNIKIKAEDLQTNQTNTQYFQIQDLLGLLNYYTLIAQKNLNNTVLLKQIMQITNTIGQLLSYQFNQVKNFHWENFISVIRNVVLLESFIKKQNPQNQLILQRDINQILTKIISKIAQTNFNFSHQTINIIGIQLSEIFQIYQNQETNYDQQQENIEQSENTDIQIKFLKYLNRYTLNLGQYNFENAQIMENALENLEEDQEIINQNIPSYLQIPQLIKQDRFPNLDIYKPLIKSQTHLINSLYLSVIVFSKNYEQKTLNNSGKDGEEFGELNQMNQYIFKLWQQYFKTLNFQKKQDDHQFSMISQIFTKENILKLQRINAFFQTNPQFKNNSKFKFSKQIQQILQKQEKEDVIRQQERSQKLKQNVKEQILQIIKEKYPQKYNQLTQEQQENLIQINQINNQINIDISINNKTAIILYGYFQFFDSPVSLFYHDINLQKKFNIYEYEINQLNNANNIKKINNIISKEDTRNINMKGTILENEQVPLINIYDPMALNILKKQGYENFIIFFGKSKEQIINEIKQKVQNIQLL